MKTDRSVPKERHKPVRTCVACRQESGKQQLVRLVRRPQGDIALDPTGRAAGRGAYVHPAKDCIEVARKRRVIDRALGVPVTPQIWEELAGLE